MEARSTNRKFSTSIEIASEVGITAADNFLSRLGQTQGFYAKTRTPTKDPHVTTTDSLAGTGKTLLKYKQKKTFFAVSTAGKQAVFPSLFISPFFFLLMNYSRWYMSRNEKYGGSRTVVLRRRGVVLSSSTSWSEGVVGELQS